MVMETIGNIGNDVLPNDIMLDIFLRLSVKTLKRFTCVCKSWGSTLQSSNFITSYNHNNNNNISNKRLFAYVEASSPHHESHILCLSLLPNETTEVKSSYLTSYFGLYSRICECEGLICMYDVYGYKTFVLLNPATGEHKILHRRETPKNLHGMELGYDSINNDYKIVTFIDIASYDVSSSKITYIHCVEVYSLSNNCWKVISCPLTNKQRVLEYSDFNSTYLNGCCHFLIWERKPYDTFILAFDVSQETFRIITFPIGFDKRLRWCMDTPMLRILDNHLSFSVTSKRKNNCFEIWVMEDYSNSKSWIQQTVIGPILRVKELRGMWTDREWFFDTKDGELKLYDPKTKMVKTLVSFRHAFKDTQGMPYQIISVLRVFTAKENLLSLNETRTCKKRTFDLSY